MFLAELQKQEDRNATPATTGGYAPQQSREQVSESQLAAQLGGAPGWLDKR